MKDKKTSTLVYKGLGFPIKLENTPMIKLYGEWFLDINFNELQLLAINMLVHKPAPLTSKELGFIRAYLGKTETQFGKIFGVSGATFAKWENNQAKMSPALELCIRLYVLNHVKTSDKEFRALYTSLSLEKLTKPRKTKMFSIDASKLLLAIKPAPAP